VVSESEHLEKRQSRIEDAIDKLTEISADLNKIIESLYEPANFKIVDHQLGGLHSVPHSGNVIFPVKQALWIDFDGIVSFDGNLQWCTDEERSFLNRLGIVEYAISKQIKLEFEALQRSILNSEERCILIHCLENNGEPKQKHPLESYLLSLLNQLPESQYSPNSIKRFINHPNDIRDLFDFDLSIEAILPRSLPQAGLDYFIFKENLSYDSTHESASSLEQLIQHPFAWLVDYNAKFKDRGDYNIPDISLLQGNVAHAAVQQLILESFNKEGLVSLPSVDTIGSTFDSFIQQEAAIFLLPENRFLQEEFKRRFVESAMTIIQFIHKNELRDPQCEVSFGFEDDVNQPKLNETTQIVGFIDLLLTDADGNKVIIDLKWTDNKKRYVEKVESGSNIQLAIYNLAEGGACKTGYYLMSKPTFVTRHDFISVEGMEMKKLDVPITSFENNVIVRLCKSYEFRMSELKAGKAELGYDSIFEFDLESANQLEWFDHLTGGTTHTDFFAIRSTDYAKAGEDENWSDEELWN
jgi:hypothetical protein